MKAGTRWSCTRHGGVRALAALIGVVVVGGGLVAGQAPNLAVAAGRDIVRVDFADDHGAYRGGVSGYLYGLGSQGVPSQAVINGAWVTNISTKPPQGTQHPTGDALDVADGLFAKSGELLAVYMQDFLPDWYYVRPGDTRTYNTQTGEYTDAANGIWDYYEMVEYQVREIGKYEAAQAAPQPGRWLFIPYNEVGGRWGYVNGGYNDLQKQEWKEIYRIINDTWHEYFPASKPLIGGPGDGSWMAANAASLLDLGMAEDCLPSVMIWHELHNGSGSSIRSHYASYRALERARGLDPMPILISEWGEPWDMARPGTMLLYLSVFEDLKVGAQTAYWNYAGNLSDNMARTSGGNGGWWLYKWLGDLVGAHTVGVSVPKDGEQGNVQAIGALNDQSKQATVIFGGGSNNVGLDLQNLPADFGPSVDIEVREVAFSGAEGFHGNPRVVFAADRVPLSEAGVPEFGVPVLDPNAIYQVIVTPSVAEDLTAEFAAQGWQGVIEAENAALSGAAAIRNEATARYRASGDRDVQLNASAASAVSWTVDVPADGEYRLQLVDATPGTPGRVAIAVDGAVDQVLNLIADLAHANGATGRYRGSNEAILTLTRGQHVISVRTSADGQTVLPGSNIALDKLLLTQQNNDRERHPASTARLFGGAKRVYDDTSLPGAIRLSGASQRADLYVHAWESGYYDLTARYATTQASDLELTVNGKALEAFAAPAAGGWETTVTVHLGQGINEIELRSAAGADVELIRTARNRAADASTTVIEAETGVLSGTASVINVAASKPATNASGGKAVGGLGKGLANSLSVPLPVGSTGSYDITLSYANGTVQGNHAYNPQVLDLWLDIYEVGSGADRLVDSTRYRYTHSADSFWDHLSKVELTGGQRLKFTTQDFDGGPVVDKIAISPVTAKAALTKRVLVTQQPEIGLSTTPPPSAWYDSVPAVNIPPAPAGTVVEHSLGGGTWVAGGQVAFSEGVNELQVRYRDVESGAVSASTSAVVRVDTQAPFAAAQVELSGRKVRLDAADAGTGVETMEYRIDGGAWQLYGGEPFALDSASHVVGYRASDKMGHVSAELSLQVPAAQAPLIPTTLVARFSGQSVVQGEGAELVAKAAVPAGSGATGTISVKDGSQLLAAGTLADGQVTLRVPNAGLAVGDHTLSVQYSGDDRYAGASTSLTLTVRAANGNPGPSQGEQLGPVVSKVKLGQSQLTLVKGKSLQLPGAVYYADVSLPRSGKLVWSSSDPKIATVSATGKVSAKQAGTVTITATSVEANVAGRQVSASVKATVANKNPKAKVTSVKASVPKTLVVGQVSFVTGKYASAKAAGVKVTYKSSKASVVEADSAGRLLAKSKGTARITVKAASKSKTYKVTVK